MASISKFVFVAVMLIPVAGFAQSGGGGGGSGGGGSAGGGSGGGGASAGGSATGQSHACIRQADVSSRMV